jgi:hypothetical protein
VYLAHAAGPDVLDVLVTLRELQSRRMIFRFGRLLAAGQDRLQVGQRLVDRGGDLKGERLLAVVDDTRRRDQSAAR